MITIKNKGSIAKMEHAGKLLSELFRDLERNVTSGMTTLELDALISQGLTARGLVSKSKGYRGYRHVSCISVNDVVVHGVPDQGVVLKDGDLVKVDVCASWQGYCADMARCFFVGSGSEQAKKLVEVAEAALQLGISKARVGNRLSDISNAIQQEVERHGFGVVRDFAGHGIGKQMHEDPEIPNFGPAGKGPVLQPGMTFALEPMITMGNYEVRIMGDGWTVKTVDGSLAAHVEDTIVVTHAEPKVLTRSNDQRVMYAS